MRKEEQILREVLRMWEPGIDGILESFRQHAHPDIVWWNSGRGSVEGLDGCLEALKLMQQTVGWSTVKVPVKTVLADDGIVMVERSDDLYAEDGSLIVEIPVTGVVVFEADKIINWRDYTTDWISQFMTEDATVGSWQG